MIDFTTMKKLTVDGVDLKTLAINGIQVWKNGYTNQVPISIDANGKIYNGCGYKDGYRIRSGGAEVASDNTACTGFIPVNGGDVVRIYPVDKESLGTSGTAFNVYNVSFTNLGQAASNGAYGIFANTYKSYSWGNSTVDEGDGIYRWIVPPVASGVAYIRVSLYKIDGGCFGADMIVTINEEIE